MRIAIGRPLKMMTRPPTALSREKIPKMIRGRDRVVLAWEWSPLAAKGRADCRLPYSCASHPVRNASLPPDSLERL